MRSQRRSHSAAIDLLVVSSLALALWSCNSHRTEPTVSAEPVVQSSNVPDASVRFKVRQARVGDHWSETESSVSDMSGDAGGHKFAMHRETLKERKTEVLRVEGGRAVKVRVTYSKDSSTQTTDGNPTQSTKGPVEGHAYLAERKDGTLSVTSDSGGALTQDETNVMIGDYEELGIVSPIDEALASKPRSVGDSLEDVAAAFGKKVAHDAAVAAGGKSEPATVDLHLTSVDKHGDQAIGAFDVKVTSNVLSRGATFVTNLTGTLHGSVDALESLEQTDTVMSGPIVISGTIQGSGAMTMTFKIRYE